MFFRGLRDRENKELRVERVCVAKKARRLLVPYFVWGVISVAVFLILQSVMGEMRGYDGYYGERMFVKEWWRPFVSLLHAALSRTCTL